MREARTGIAVLAFTVAAAVLLGIGIWNVAHQSGYRDCQLERDEEDATASFSIGVGADGIELRGSGRSRDVVHR